MLYFHYKQIEVIMNLLTGSKIMEKFEEYTQEAESIDFAIAWVTHSSGLELLCNQANTRKLKVRAIVGVDTNFTNPEALKKLGSIANLRVTAKKRGIFHPKMYIFHFSNKSIVWIGSANFTNSGLAVNEELVAEITSSTNEAITWFEERFASINIADSEQMMKKHIKEWKPPAKMKTNFINENEETQEIDFLKNCDWVQYMKQLWAYNYYWLNVSNDSDTPFSVLDDTSSWFTTISSGYDVMRYDSWDNLSQQDADIIIGLERKGKETVYALLGYASSGKVKNIFLRTNEKNRKTRRIILKAIQETIEANTRDDYLESVKNAFGVISQFDRFAHGIISRFLTLARPDMAISVNTASCMELARLAGLAPSTLGKSQNYIKLLKWLYSLDWYNAPKPEDDSGIRAWKNRAAFIDVFVYKPK